jgi:hypothetical protein
LKKKNPASLLPVSYRGRDRGRLKIGNLLALLPIYAVTEAFKAMYKKIGRGFRFSLNPDSKYLFFFITEHALLCNSVLRSFTWTKHTLRQILICQTYLINFVKFVIFPNLKIKRYNNFIVHTRIIKSIIFWDITPWSPLKVNRHFGGTCCLHLQGWRISQERNQREAGSKENLLSRIRGLRD